MTKGKGVGGGGDLFGFGVMIFFFNSFLNLLDIIVFGIIIPTFWRINCQKSLDLIGPYCCFYIYNLRDSFLSLVFTFEMFKIITIWVICFLNLLDYIDPYSCY